MDAVVYDALRMRSSLDGKRELLADLWIFGSHSPTKNVIVSWDHHNHILSAILSAFASTERWILLNFRS
jgi:hypothetical protein